MAAPAINKPGSAAHLGQQEVNGQHIFFGRTVGQKASKHMLT